jgi:single-stranded-DNA-specific exonuclease
MRCPKADVIVNPNLKGSPFGSRALAGVGVAFYVMAALYRKLEAAGELPPGAPTVARYLDLVALGTVADVVPLDLNNRILVAQGLARIRARRAVPGILALLTLAKREIRRAGGHRLGLRRRASTERCRAAHRHVGRDPLPLSDAS